MTLTDNPLYDKTTLSITQDKTQLENIPLQEIYKAKKRSFMKTRAHKYDPLASEGTLLPQYDQIKEKV